MAGWTSIFAVQVSGRDDGLYLFASQEHARTFAGAVELAGGEATLTEEPVAGQDETLRLVHGELDSEVGA